jgi:hypothetical protein
MWLKMTRWPERLACGALCVFAILAAGLAYGHARFSLAQSVSDGGNDELALLHLEASRALAPIDSRWHYIKARVSLAAAERDHANALALRDTGTQHLRQALTLSPMWSDPWSWLAVSELQQNESSELLQLSLSRSLILGPNETRNLVALLPWALLRWETLSAKQQEQILVATDRAARWVPGWVVATAARYGQLYAICDRIQTRVWANKHCQRAGWTLKERSDPS